MKEHKRWQTKERLERLLGQRFSSEETEKLHRFTKALNMHSLKYNLVSKKDLINVLERHIADSLVLRPYIAKASSVIDIGSGAGFPGIPLSICAPGTKFYLVEPRFKRAAFLKSVKRELKLLNIAVLEGRIEEFGSIIKNVDMLVLRGVGGLGDILSHIRENIQLKAEIFVLTSQERRSTKFSGFELKTIKYSFLNSKWKGSIWRLNVSRETNSIECLKAK